MSPNTPIPALSILELTAAGKGSAAALAAALAVAMVVEVMARVDWWVGVDLVVAEAALQVVETVAA